jgi:hypothetical protein
MTDTPTLASVIEELNVRSRAEGFAPAGIRCLFPEMGRMCGYAVTDENGLISVPECDVAALGRAVDSVRGRERNLMDFLRSAECTAAGFEERFLE